MKRAFTLIELLIVVIIIGILASFGIVRYQRTAEIGRTAEAKMNLGILRTMELDWAEDNNDVYTDDIVSAAGLESGLPAGADFNCNAANTNYYFQYACDTAGLCTAYRCVSNGKRPSAASGYFITLDINGTFNGTAGYY